MEQGNLERGQQSVVVPERRVDLEPQVPEIRRRESSERAVRVQGKVAPHCEVAPVC